MTEYTKPTIYYPVKVESDTFDGYLQCPVCDDIYIHQYETNIYYRSEDDDRCMVTSAQYGRSYTVERDNAGNPSDTMTPQMARDIRRFHAANPDLTYHEIAVKFNVQIGRISDAPFDPRNEQVIFEEDPA